MKPSKRRKIDMTGGPIMKPILLFALPMVIGNILQYMYTTVDTLVVSRYCGDASIAAVGTSSQPVEILLCIFLGIGTGASILVAQYVGARQEDKLREITGTTVSFVYMVGIPLTVLGYFCAPLILKFMNVPADVWEEALAYTRLVLLGAIGNIGYNMNAGLLRGLGDSRASLYFLVVSCLANILLDLLFVAGFSMGVGGVAISTSLAMCLSWIISVIYIRRHFPEIEFSFLPRTFSGTELKKILKLGVPIGLNNSLYSFGHMALQTMINSQGKLFMAGCSIGGRITSLSNIAITGLSGAATTFSGQNYGAKNYRRLKQGHWRIPLTSGLITFCFGMFFLTIRMPILRIFSQDPEVLLYAGRFVMSLLLSQWCYAIFNGIICFVNGVGKVRYTTVVNILMLWAVRVPVAYVITHFFDGTFVTLCYPISFFFGMVCMVSYYLFSPGWKKIMALAEEAPGQALDKEMGNT